ncbi:MAG: biotin/lipoyl-binding protein [Rhizomicrobium sp.]
MAIAVLALAAILAILWAWDLWPFGGRIETTDDAYVRGRTTVIAPQVSGYVAAVPVHDYQQVRAGDVLVLIDDRIYRARVAQAAASVAAAIAALDNSDQAHAARVAASASARAQLLRAQADMARVNDLVRDGSVSIRERDQTLAALAQAQAGGQIAVQDIRSVDVGREGLRAQVEAARAQLRPGRDRSRPYRDPRAGNRPAQRGRRAARAICDERHAIVFARAGRALDHRQLQGRPDGAYDTRRARDLHRGRARRLPA